jgi:putative peptidoglycan lipid II flippase
VVAILLVAALVTAAVTAGTTSSGLGWLRTLVGRPDGSDASGPAPRSLPIASVHSFDPNGDNRENDDKVAAVVDQDPATVWSTELYRSRDMAGKGGVGLIIELSENTGEVTIDVTTNGSDWGASVFRSNADTPPRTLAGWGPPAATGRSSNGVLPLPTKGSGRWLLVWVTDPGVSAPRFSLSIAELVVNG